MRGDRIYTAPDLKSGFMVHAEGEKFREGFGWKPEENLSSIQVAPPHNIHKLQSFQDYALRRRKSYLH